MVSLHEQTFTAVNDLANKVTEDYESGKYNDVVSHCIEYFQFRLAGHPEISDFDGIFLSHLDGVSRKVIKNKEGKP